MIEELMDIELLARLAEDREPSLYFIRTRHLYIMTEVIQNQKADVMKLYSSSVQEFTYT